jgi:Domain of unknown function (DUF6438)
VDEPRRRELVDTMTEPSSAEDVIRAIASFGVRPSVKIYVERSGRGYRWSMAHRGGSYPLLREVATFLDLPYTSLLLPCTGVQGWTVIAPTGFLKYVPTSWAILEASDDSEEIARGLAQLDAPRQDVPGSLDLGMPLVGLGIVVSLISVVARLQVGAWTLLWILWIGVASTVLGLGISMIGWLAGRTRRRERQRISRVRQEQQLEKAEKLRAVEEEVMAQLRPAGLAEKITEISLSRGPCLGNCPVYTVDLRLDGTATWHGEGFFGVLAVPPTPQDRVGDFIGHFAKDRLVVLADLVERSGFFTWDEAYRSSVTDQATIEIEVTIGWLAKRLVSVYGRSGPRGFDEATLAIDEVANAVSWSPASSSSPTEAAEHVSLQTPRGS